MFSVIRYKLTEPRRVFDPCNTAHIIDITSEHLPKRSAGFSPYDSPATDAVGARQDMLLMWQGQCPAVFSGGEVRCCLRHVMGCKLVSSDSACVKIGEASCVSSLELIPWQKCTSLSDIIGCDCME